jgi:integrase
VVYFYSAAYSDIADYAAWRANEHKVEDVTIRHDLHNLSKFMQYAMKHNWRRDNPVIADDIPSDEDAVRMYIFTPVEEAAYLQAAERHPKLHALVSLMLYQGCRPDELLAVEMIHVDLERRYLRIEKSKTKAGKRRLRIRPEALPIIAQLIKDATGPYLFASERSARRNLSLSTVENWHAKVREVTGIPCVIYDWRHTFATRAANGGMSLATLAKILGHGSLRSVMKYVHPDQDEQDRALEQLSRTETVRKPESDRVIIDPKGVM